MQPTQSLMALFYFSLVFSVNICCNIYIMKQQLLVLSVLVVFVSGFHKPGDTDYLRFFKEWKVEFEKVYKDLETEEHRFSVWMNNYDYIQKHNFQYDMKKKSYRLEMNHFGDMNNSEFTSIVNGYRNDKRANRKPGATYLRLLSLTNESIPDTVDWRKEGYVTPVKNQGQCGSCWAFSTTGSLEGQHKKKTGNLVSLSEQNLVDCSGPEGNDGCEGGLMDQAFRYIKINNGLDTETSYPYQAEDMSCRFRKADVGADDTGYVDIPRGDEEALKEAAATVGPISVAIDASHPSFQFYSYGIYDEPDCSSEQLDHGVLVVGYGVLDGVDYWLVKNSWGSNWGDQGYLKMSRNKNNQCGIATQASYPLV